MPRVRRRSLSGAVFADPDEFAVLAPDVDDRFHFWIKVFRALRAGGYLRNLPVRRADDVPAVAGRHNADDILFMPARLLQHVRVDVPPGFVHVISAE